MALIDAPFAGSLDWQVDEGVEVAALEVLAWVSVADHCAVRPLLSPARGRIAWRRATELGPVERGEPVALLGEDAEARSRCLAAERRAVDALIARLLIDRAALATQLESPLREAVLGPELRSIDARLERLRER